MEIVRAVDLRYRRQTNDLVIPVPERPFTEPALRALVDRFEASYEQVYGKGSAFREAGIELTNVRVEAFGRSHRPEIAVSHGAGNRVPSHRQIFEPVADAWMRAEVHDWRDLSQGARIDGPAVIEHPETSVFVAQGQTASVDASRNITIEPLERS